MFKKILNTFGTKFLTAAINFAIAAVISQAVGDVGKGEQTLMLTTITFILIFSDIISGSALVYLAPKHPFSKLLLPSYLWSTLVGLVAAGIIPLFYHDLGTGITLHICTLAVLSSLSTVNTTLLVGKERVTAANYANLWQPVSILTTLLICYFYCDILNINAYIIALYIAYGGSFLISLGMLGKAFRSFRFHAFKEYKNVLKDLCKYGILNQAGHFVQFFNLRLNYYLLASYVDKGSTGIFSNAVSLAEAIWIIARSIALVQYARIANADDTDYSQKLTLKLIKICFAFSFAAILALSCFPSAFFLWFFGPEFGAVGILIRILAPGVLLFSIYLLVGHYYSGIGRYEMNIYSSLCGLVFTFVLGFTLIPRYSIYGAAVTTSIAYAANAIFLIVFFFAQSRFKLRDCLISKEDVRYFKEQARLFIHSKNSQNNDEQDQ